MLKRREERDIYLTLICRHCWDRKSQVKIDEISGAFSQHCHCRLTKVLASAARREKGSKGGGGRVRLSNVDTRELAGYKDKLIFCFILAADMVRGGTYKQKWQKAQSKTIWRDFEVKANGQECSMGLSDYSTIIMAY